jgi:uncharacterized membrane protein
MSIYVLAFLVGVVAGLRSMTAPAGVSWGFGDRLLPQLGGFGEVVDALGAVVLDVAGAAVG